MIEVVGTKYVTPFSKGILAGSLIKAGLDVDKAYYMAEDIRKKIAASHKHKITEEELTAKAYQALLEEGYTHIASYYRMWHTLREKKRPIVVLLGGATGIGKKTAVELLQEYGSIDNLYKAIEKCEAWDLKEKTKKLLMDYKEQVGLSFSLAKARNDAAIDFSLEKCRWKGYNKEKATAVIKKYEFYTLLSRLEK